MRYVIWEDKRGYLRRSLIKDTDGDGMAEYGIPAGPPDFDSLDWDEIKREIHNALAKNEVFDWTDVQRSSTGLAPALNVIKWHLIHKYREDSMRDRSEGG